jgi:hypothetical protein
MRIMSSFGHTLLLFVCIVLAGLASAAAHVTTLRIDRVEPFAAHATFGDTGAYERVIGIARGELDPADARNKLIVGIDRAPRNAAGMVEYETDLFILRPVDPAKGNRQLLFDVLNRGNKVVTNRLNRTMPQDDSNDPSSSAHAGDSFLFRRGYTIAWAGWNPDAPLQSAISGRRDVRSRWKLPAVRPQRGREIAWRSPSVNGRTIWHSGTIRGASNGGGDATPSPPSPCHSEADRAVVRHA